MPVQTHNRSGVPSETQLGELSIEELTQELRRVELKLSTPQRSMLRKLTLKKLHAVEREIEHRRSR